MPNPAFLTAAVGKCKWAKAHRCVLNTPARLQLDLGKAEILNGDNKNVSVPKFKYRLHRTGSAASTGDKGSCSSPCHLLASRGQSSFLSKGAIYHVQWPAQKRSQLFLHMAACCRHTGVGFPARETCTIRQRLQNWGSKRKEQGGSARSYLADYANTPWILCGLPHLLIFQQ